MDFLLPSPEMQNVTFAVVLLVAVLAFSIKDQFEKRHRS
jgi:hypothetical protein